MLTTECRLREGAILPEWPYNQKHVYDLSSIQPLHSATLNIYSHLHERVILEKKKLIRNLVEQIPGATYLL